jgi:hypothetical protein
LPKEESEYEVIQVFCSHSAHHRMLRPSLRFSLSI